MCGEIFHYLRVKDLYSQAIELYLLAHERRESRRPQELDARSSRPSALADKAMSFGLVLDSMQRLHAEAADDALFDRYISTGQIGPLVYKHEGMTRALEPLQ
jgi:hypothetical protein